MTLGWQRLSQRLVVLSRQRRACYAIHELPSGLSTMIGILTVVFTTTGPSTELFMTVEVSMELSMTTDCLLNLGLPGLTVPGSQPQDGGSHETPGVFASRRRVSLDPKFWPWNGGTRTLRRQAPLGPRHERCGPYDVRRGEAYENPHVQVSSGAPRGSLRARAWKSGTCVKPRLLGPCCKTVRRRICQHLCCEARSSNPRGSPWEARREGRGAYGKKLWMSKFQDDMCALDCRLGCPKRLCCRLGCS